jgi:hypothetical protein
MISDEFLQENRGASPSDKSRTFRYNSQFTIQSRQIIRRNSNKSLFQKLDPQYSSWCEGVGNLLKMKLQLRFTNR